MKQAVCALICAGMSLLAYVCGADPSPWGAAGLVILALYREEPK